MNARSIVGRAIPIFLGAGAGFAYYSFIGCYSGTCPITSNPWLMTGYGAFVGAVLVPWKKKDRTQPSPSGGKEDESTS